MVLTAVLLAAAAMKALAPGIEYGEFESPVKSAYGDSLFRVARIDPRAAQLNLFSASAEPDQKAKTAHDWAKSKNLSVVINASMFQKDRLRSVSLLRSKGHTNYGRAGKDKTFLVFGPLSSKLPAAKILDKECDDVDAFLPRFTAAVQDIRMLSCTGKTVWAQQAGKSWSIAAIGEDADGRILLVHSRSPYTVRDFVEHLKALPLRVKRLMYADGGIPAEFYLNAGGTEVDVVGGYNEANGDTQGVSVATPLPNVLGVSLAP